MTKRKKPKAIDRGRAVLEALRRVAPEVCPAPRPPPRNPLSASIGQSFNLSGTFHSVEPWAFMWDAKLGVEHIAAGCYTRNDPESCIRAACAEVVVTCEAINRRRGG